MLEMASLGAKVMQPVSIRPRLGRVDISKISLNKSGTLITKRKI